jgi:hypothetical protein
VKNIHEEGMGLYGPIVKEIKVKESNLPPRGVHT